MKLKKSLPWCAFLILAILFLVGLLTTTALAFTGNTGLSAAGQAQLPEKGVFLNQTSAPKAPLRGGFSMPASAFRRRRD